MTEKVQTGTRAGPGDSDAQKKRLIQRLGVAAVLIAALLAGLALFERGELQEAPVPTAGTPAPAASQFARGQVQAVAQVQPEAEKPAPAAEPAPPAGEAATPPLVPPEPQSPEVPRANAGRKPVQAAPVRVAAAPSPAAALTPPAIVARAAAPTQTPVQAATAQSMPAAVPAAAPRASPASPATAAPVSVPHLASAAYLVQVGAYSPVGDAEVLRAKLAGAGIPALVQARVRAGPFATREEAAAARAKIKAMGLETSILLPFHR